MKTKEVVIANPVTIRVLNTIVEAFEILSDCLEIDGHSEQFDALIEQAKLRVEKPEDRVYQIVKA